MHVRAWLQMNSLFRKTVALLLCDLLILLPMTGCAGRRAAEVAQPPTLEEGTLRARLQEPYLELFDPPRR
jgi:hypothetical protein